RNQRPRKDHQPAHRGLALLGQQVALRPILADRLALALPHPQRIDHAGAEQEHEEQRRDDRAACPEREVTEDIEDRKRVCELLQEIEHGTWSVPSPALRRSAANENYKAFPAKVDPLLRFGNAPKQGLRAFQRFRETLKCSDTPNLSRIRVTSLPSPTPFDPLSI